MKDSKKGTESKTEHMLDELESIKSLLDDDLDNIPVLEEMIEDDAELLQTDSPQADSPMGFSGALPGQQTLFKPENIAALSTNHAAKTHNDSNDSNDSGAPSTDNPFLPKHIRDRLGSTAEYADSIALQQRNLEKQSLTMPLSSATVYSPYQTTPTTFTNPTIAPQSSPKQADSIQSTMANPDPLIESLVDQFLPAIKDELRRRLQQLKDQSSF